MKYEAIEANSSIFEVRKMCKVLGLKPCNYYRWKRRQAGNLEKKRQELKDIRIIRKAFDNSDRTYGYRTIKRQLDADGHKISEYKVRRIMRENGMYPETQKKYKTRYGTVILHT